MAWVLFSRWLETLSNSSSTVHKRGGEMLIMTKNGKNYSCYTDGCGVFYLSDSLQRSWQFPGRDDKAAVDATCPRKSGTGRCSLGGALNPAVSAAVPAFCKFALCIIKTGFKKKYCIVKCSEIHSAGRCTHLASLLGSALKGILIVAVCKVKKTSYFPGLA